MKLSEFKNILATVENVSFSLEDGSSVPAHFHVTEVGAVHKHFIDCGGTVRSVYVVNFQLWSADDTEHQLLPERLLQIISLSEDTLGLTDGDIEVEYQKDTIGKYGLVFNNGVFVLTTTKTDCLAIDACGIPVKKKISLSNLTKSQSCTPDSGCC